MISGNLTLGTFCRHIVIVLICLFLQLNLFAQDDRRVSVTIRALELRSGATSDGESNFEYRVNTWFNNGLNGNCIDFTDVARNVFHPIKASDQIRVFGYVMDVGQSFGIEGEGWEEDGCGGDCSYNTSCGGSDEAHAGRQFVLAADPVTLVPGAVLSISPWNLIPGDYSGQNTGTFFISGGGGYWVKYQISYNPPTPNTPGIQFKSPTESSFSNYVDSEICSQSIIQLTTNVQINPAFKGYVSYRYQYYILGDNYFEPNPEYCGDDPFNCPEPDPLNPLVIRSPCCDVDPIIEVQNWQDLPGGEVNANVNGGSISFDVRSLSGLNNITEKKTVLFRVLARANNLTSAFSAVSIPVKLSPRAPTFSSLTTTPSCLNRADGSISVTDITGDVGNYRYVLRFGADPSPCDDNCLNVSSSGVPSGTTLSLNNIASNQYTLLISNPGDLNGVCYTAQTFTIATKPILDVPIVNPSNISCFDNAEGSVAFTTINGDQSALTFSLANNPFSSTTPSGSNGSWSFSNLPVGPYSMTVNDGGCSNSVTKNFSINRPKKVSKVSFQKADAICNDPGNGILQIEVTKSSGTFDIAAPSTNDYLYHLVRNGTTWNDVITTNTILNRSDLPPGNYQILVKESGGLDCNGYSENFNIAAPSVLGIDGSAISITHVTCNSGNDGAIAFTPQGGSNQYTFELTQGATQLSGDTPSFASLSAGAYNLTVINASPGCNDRYNHPSPITVSEPIPISINLNATHLTCFESDDGIISAMVSGGTPSVSSPGYNFNWEKSDSFGSWASFPGSSTAISNLFIGNYRLRITDSRNCPATSQTVTITQPDPVQITTVTPQDVVCFGATGSLAITPSGGTAPYTFYYSSDDGNSFQPLVPLQPGSYLVRTIDSNGCEISDYDNYYTITGPDEPLDFTYNTSNFNSFTNKCSGDNSGTISIDASGGNDYGYNGYTFTINNGTYVATNFFDQLSAGNQLVSVQDGRGCVVTKNITFTQPPALTSSLTQLQQVDCFGSSTGFFETTAAGGVGPYTYRLGTGSAQPSGFYSNLPAGNYSVMITDNNSCVSTFNQSIVNLFPEIVVTPLVTHVKCFGGQDGAIALNVSGGDGTYDFLRETNPVSNPVNALTAGSYQFTVLDGKGCRAETGNILVNQPEALVINDVQRNDIRCLGETGSIEIQSSGGVTPYIYQYSTDNGASFSTFTAVTPLPVGDYRVRTVDTNGCELLHPETFSITAPVTALDYSFTQSDYNGFNISCNGKSDGFITLEATGGNGSGYSGYTYAVDASPYQNENVLSGLNAGDHVLLVKDARGCVVQKTIGFTESISVTSTLAQKTDIDCFGAATGILQASAAGGSGTYQYQIGTSEFVTANIFSGLTAGEYTITARDENGCAASFNHTLVHLHAPISIAVRNINDALCYQSSDGSIELDVSGGAGTYQYKLAGQASSNPVPNLSAGIYKITVTDQKGCSVESMDITVGHPDELLVSQVTVADIRCLGESGRISITGSGGTLPYDFEYKSNNRPTFTSFTSSTPLGASDYQLRITDAHGCQSPIANSVITEPKAQLDFTYSLSDYKGFNISCYGGANGFATIIPSGGNDASYSGYQFTIDSRPFTSTNLLTDINAGEHILSVRDGRGCVVQKNVPFSQSDEQITGVVTPEDVACPESLNGKIQVTSQGGGLPHKYKLDNGSFQELPQFQNLGVGNYVVTISDRNDCAITIPASIVNTIPEMQISTQVSDIKCFGGIDGAITVNVTSGGIAPFEYQWEGLIYTTNSLQLLKPGTYSLTITDQGGCQKRKDITVVQPAAPLRINPSVVAACYGKSDGVITVAASGGTSPYRYSIDNGTTFQTGPTFTVPVGSYPLQVVDSNGCATGANTIVAQRNERPEPNFIVATTRHALDTLVLSEISVPRPTSVEWTFDPRAIIISNQPWEPKIKFNEEGTYTISMRAIYPLGCDYAITKALTILPFDPNAIKERQRGYKAIEKISVNPNPTDGTFTVNVELSKRYNLTLLIFDVTGTVHYNRRWEEVSALSETITLPNAAAGVYVLRALTEYGAEDVRIVVNK